RGWDKFVINNSTSTLFNFVTIKNLAGERGDYHGMEINNSSTTLKNTIITKPDDMGFSGLLVKNSTSTFSNVEVSGFKDREGDYGEFETALSIENSNVEIDNSSIKDNYKGLVINGSNFSLTNNNFINNNEEPVFIQNSFPENINNNSFSNNKYNGIFIESLWFKNNQISFYKENPYIINSTLTVPEEKELKINPGSVIKFNIGKNASIKAEGIIEAEGKKDKPIIFTGLRDNLEDIANEYGEEYETNTDSSSNSSTPGSWGNISLKNNEATSTLSNAIIRYGGRDSNSVVEVSGKSEILNSVFENNMEGGLFIESGTSSVIKNNIFNKNNTDNHADSGLYLTTDGLPKISNNLFKNNAIGFYWKNGNNKLGEDKTCEDIKDRLGIFKDNETDLYCSCCKK
ncbi:MAG: right-handed parallel beta-helix repeat-containing protein, partial [Candidatus Woesearchaeota archaeon]